MAPTGKTEDIENKDILKQVSSVSAAMIDHLSSEQLAFAVKFAEDMYQLGRCDQQNVLQQKSSLENEDLRAAKEDDKAMGKALLLPQELIDSIENAAYLKGVYAANSDINVPFSCGARSNSEMVRK